MGLSCSERDPALHAVGLWLSPRQPSHRTGEDPTSQEPWRVAAAAALELGPTSNLSMPPLPQERWVCEEPGCLSPLAGSQ